MPKGNNQPKNLTPTARLVYAVIRSSEKTLTAREIMDRLADKGFPFAENSIYGAIRKMRTDGVLKETDVAKGSHAVTNSARQTEKPTKGKYARTVAVGDNIAWGFGRLHFGEHPRRRPR